MIHTQMYQNVDFILNNCTDITKNMQKNAIKNVFEKNTGPNCDRVLESGP